LRERFAIVASVGLAASAVIVAPVPIAAAAGATSADACGAPGCIAAVWRSGVRRLYLPKLEWNELRQPDFEQLAVLEPGVLEEMRQVDGLGHPLRIGRRKAIQLRQQRIGNVVDEDLVLLRVHAQVFAGDFEAHWIAPQVRSESARLVGRIQHEFGDRLSEATHDGVAARSKSAQVRAVNVERLRVRQQWVRESLAKLVVSAGLVHRHGRRRVFWQHCKQGCGVVPARARNQRVPVERCRCSVVDSTRDGGGRIGCNSFQTLIDDVDDRQGNLEIRTCDVQLA